MAYLNVVKVEDALRQMKERFDTKSTECRSSIELIDLNRSPGRCLAKDLIAAESLPAFRRSMVDGYAVKSTETTGASEQAPIMLQNMGSVEMGRRADLQLQSGCTVQVPTGGEIPTGADAMVMVEHTEVLGPDIAIFATAAYGEHVVDIGEDVLEKTVVLTKGTRLASRHGALLASLGHAMVPVVRRPRVAILSTGDELVDVSSTPASGQVRDCNGTIIRQVVESCGGEVVLSSRVIDCADALEEHLKRAVELADVVIMSGGSSAGAKDMTQAVIDGNGSNVFIHGLAIKPGKPTIVGQLGDVAVIGLPGHPAACFITMKALVEPFLKYLSGENDNKVTCIPCISGFKLHAAGGRDTYQLVELVDAPVTDLSDRKVGRFDDVLPTARILHGKSGMVSAMSRANAYVVIPMHHEGVNEGDLLMAHLL